MASISIRESIRWLPEPASEPTSTVVLTSPGRRFVDLRILRAESSSNNDNSSVGAEDPDSALDEGELPFSRLDWAFAGYSHSETRGDGSTHSVWRHFVDSRTMKPEKATDEGDMFTQQDGRTLEIGRMINPATDQETDYEEVWVDEDIRGITQAHSGTITSDHGSTSKSQCVVLQLHRDDTHERGMVVYLGQYCQGVVRKDAAFALERWQWDGDIWKRLYHMGSLPLPCSAAINCSNLSVGDQVNHSDQIWDVVEVSDL